MAEDLEDGELWLPSDFFSTDEPQPPQITSFPCRCMDALRRISSPSLLPPLPQLQCMPTSLSISDPPVRYGRRTGRPWPGCSPLNPVRAQIETFMGERARPGPLVQMPNRVSKNRVYYRAAHGGTGVFLPRASSYPQAENHTLRTSDSFLRTTLPDGGRRKVYAGYGAAEVDLANVWKF